MFALRRFASAFALCALFLGILTVTVQAASAKRFETNGQRMARGLAPLRPRALFPDSTRAARRSQASSKPGPNFCPAGQSEQCCNSLESSDSPVVASLLASLSINLTTVTQVGVTCEPSSGANCAWDLLCCEEVGWYEVVALGCSAFDPGWIPY